MLSAVSLFSGCGGFDYGVAKLGVEIVWANDIDPCAAAAYKSLFPRTSFYLGNIKDVETFPKADILIGCYPCTGFSVASRRRWKDGKDRDLKENDGNHLFSEFLRALKQVRPKYLFVENVRGMITASEGWFFEQQMNGFRNLGYRVTWQLLDAADYGVPQTRKRIFIVGVSEDLDFEYRFPEPLYGPGRRRRRRTQADALRGFPEWPEGEFSPRKFHGHFLTRNRKRDWSSPSYTIVANEAHIPLHPSGDPMVYVSKDRWALQGTTNRRLSWRECAALQCLPRKVKPSGGLRDRYRVVGNSVPPPLASALVAPIVDFERSRLEPHSSASL